MARNNQNLGGVYANMDFPPYTYIEYPKHITVGPHGKIEVANNIDEEKAIRSRLQKASDDAPAEIHNYVADPEKEILISRARELGVPFNAKWSKAKLQSVVDAAELEIDNLPPEDSEAKKAAQEAAIEQQFDDEDPDPVESAEEEKTRLYEKAKSLGINEKNMHLWGASRLKSAIAEAHSK